MVPWIIMENVDVEHLSYFWFENGKLLNSIFNVWNKSDTNQTLCLL